MVGQVLESVTGKHMSITISFQNLEVDIPKLKAQMVETWEGPVMER
jgi:hypothetical protein